MKFLFQMHTDIGTTKETNQDSLCIKKALTDKGEVIMAIVCDGMGGLEKGEVASASVVCRFSGWFESDLPKRLDEEDVFGAIKYDWLGMIKKLNSDISDYGKAHNINLGSTVTVMLILENGEYIIGHVGDSRVYCIDSEIKILTEDQTVVANDIKTGRITAEQAKTDPRRNVLLQCVGASRNVEPDFIRGKAQADQCYMLCSDGFRHFVEINELSQAFNPKNNDTKENIKRNIVRITEENKKRGESDNISAILIRTM
ncbi:MAG: serine/threonine-protein phosphatase [Clostridia bacterium]|nr:serine/threonine-protein phosphatase [Clostridia bacterium]